VVGFGDVVEILDAAVGAQTQIVSYSKPEVRYLPFLSL